MNYELVYILSPKFSEEEAKEKIKEVKSILEKNQAKISLEDFWGKRDLAYPIKHFDQGWYTLIEFSAEADTIEKIDKELRLKDEIIRFLIVKKEKKEVAKVKVKKAKAVKEIKVEEKKEVIEKKVPKKKVKKLDEKLEEILKEEVEV